MTSSVSNPKPNPSSTEFHTILEILNLLNPGHIPTSHGHNMICECELDPVNLHTQRRVIGQPKAKFIPCVASLQHKYKRNVIRRQ